MDGMKLNFGEAGMHGDLVCALFAPFFPKHPNKANATHDPPTQPHVLLSATRRLLQHPCTEIYQGNGMPQQSLTARKICAALLSTSMYW